MSFTELSASEQRKAYDLLQREHRKEAARDRLYAELRAKRDAWHASK